MSAAAYVLRNLHYARPSKWSQGARAVYRRLSKSSIFLVSEELDMCSLLPSQKIDAILELVKPRTIVDVGCGTGQATTYMARLGYDVAAIEGSKAAIKKSESAHLIHQADLRYPVDLGRQFDLVWCFEVAEHIHEKYVETFVDTLVRHGPVIALSAAPPGQGGEGHFNEQPKSYWIAKFAERGYELHQPWSKVLQETPEFYSENMMVFTRAA